MIAADGMLLQAILNEPPASFATRCAQRFERFVRTQFNPNSEESWRVADRLWRAALYARALDREAAQ